MLFSLLVFASALISGCHSVEEHVATNEPQFVSRGGERSVKEGQTVELDCEVNDLGEFVLLWKFNRTTVLFAGNLRIHRDDRISRNDSTGALTIRDFRPENAGEYSCQVSTNPPQDIQYHVHLLGPPHIIPGQEEVIVKKLDPVELICETNAENIEWKKDSRHFGTQRTIKIERTTREDAGSYTCIASNEMGETARVTQLRVLYAPELVVEQRLVHAPIGQTVSVHCLVNSEPSANVNWFRSSNVKVMPSDNLLIDRNETTAALKILRVSPNDYDDYTCVANNSLGSATKSVTVSGKPSIPLFTSDPLAGRQQSYLLEWTLDSEEPITQYVIKWKSSDSNEWEETSVELKADSSNEVKRRFSHQLTSLEEDHNYEVIVLAHNKWGQTASDVFAFVTSLANHVTPSLILTLFVYIVLNKI